MKKTFIYLSLAITLFSCKKKTTEPTNNQSTTPTEVTPTIGKPGPNITDVDGNTYKTVIIGTQQWMAENLRVSKYNDGTPIPNVTDASQWSNLTNLKSGAWVYFNNDATNNAKYGKLYNWYAISPSINGNKNVCPVGWHIPTDAEWKVLTDFLGGVNFAGGKMKEVGTTNWNSPNTDATNISLFTGLPGGLRVGNGNYDGIGRFGQWWSSTGDNNTNYASYIGLKGNNGNIENSSNFMSFGISVRCIKD